MSSKSKCIVVMFAAATLLFGCAKSSLEVSKRVVGIGPSLNQEPGATSKIFIVHGIGCHSPTYSFALQDALALELGYAEERSSQSSLALYEDGEVAYARSFSLADPRAIESWKQYCTDPQKLLNASPFLLSRTFARQRVDEQPTNKLVFYELTWSPLTAKRRLRELAYDGYEATAQKRAYINHRIKQEVFNDLLADAVVYLGYAKAEIQDIVSRAFCHMWRSDEVLIDTRCSLDNHNTVAQVQSKLSDRRTSYYLVTFSLGSKLTMDTLQSIGQNQELRDLPTKMLSRTKAFFMLANQLPLLLLAAEPPSSQRKTIGPLSASAGRSEAVEAFDSLAQQIKDVVESTRSDEDVDLDYLFEQYRSAADEALFQTKLRTQLIETAKLTEQLSAELDLHQVRLTELTNEEIMLETEEQFKTSQDSSLREQASGAQSIYQVAIENQKSRQTDLDAAVDIMKKADAVAETASIRIESVRVELENAKQAIEHANGNKDRKETSIAEKEQTLEQIENTLREMGSEIRLKKNRATIRASLDYLPEVLSECLLDRQRDAEEEVVKADETHGCVRRAVTEYRLNLSDSIARDRAQLDTILGELKNLEANLRQARLHQEKAKASEASAIEGAFVASQEVNDKYLKLEAAKEHAATAHLNVGTAKAALDKSKSALRAARREQERIRVEKNIKSNKIQQAEIDLAKLRMQIDRLNSAIAEDIELDDIGAFQRLVSLSRATAHRRVVEFVNELKHIRLEKYGRAETDPVFIELLQKEKELLKQGNDLTIQVVAVSDPNDPLSYAIPPRIIDSSGDIDFVNVELEIAPSFLGLYADPLLAHEGYVSDGRVIRLIACGVDGTKTGETKVGRRAKHCRQDAEGQQTLPPGKTGAISQ